MKTALLGAAAVAALLTLSACNKQGDAPNADPGTSNAAVNAVQDAAAVPVGMASAATAGSVSDDAFVMNAAMSDMYEIEAGKIAQQRGSNAAVKAFGAMMVKDHTAMSAKLKALLPGSGANATLPEGMDERRQGLIDNLRTASAADFDKVYIGQQKAAHLEALTLVKGYADHGGNAALKAHAAEGAPKIQAHLDHVNKMAG